MSASTIQFLSGFEPRPEASHVVFDFDGTLSLLRQGWPRTMLEMFLELLTPLENEDRAALEAELVTEILSFNGKQPIHQMRAFAERVKARGGAAEVPEDYLAAYAKRLREGINERIDAIRTGRKDRDDFVLHGGRALLERLRDEGFTLFLLSGTNEDFVREEAELLGLTEFFHAGLYGGTKDPKDFSKERVYDRIMSEQGITGANLLSIGDGPVEIRATLERGGLAVAVASDEVNNGSGVIDPDKRAVLAAAGAQVMLPDYRDANELLGCIAGRRSVNIFATA
ncbi:MAG: HAD family hydrolase [Limisphaerales bacterium]